MKNPDQLVIFNLAPKLSLRARLIIAGSLIVFGFVLQTTGEESVVVGLILITLGAFFLTAKGYDSRVKMAEYDPTTNWEPAREDTFAQIESLIKKNKRWSRSPLSGNNPLGCLTIVVLVLALFVMASVLEESKLGELSYFLIWDALALFLPHWITGIKKGQNMSEMEVKAKALSPILTQLKQAWPDHNVGLELCMKGTAEKRIPIDIKIRVERKTPAEGSLGANISCVINSVQGTHYPYVYGVYVTKPGFDLSALFDSLKPPSGVIKEWSDKNEVEVIILRQHTTRTSGYHTPPVVASLIAGKVVETLESFAR